MKLITVRFLGHGITGAPLSVTAGAFVSGTARKQFEFKVPAPASGEEISPWSFLWIDGGAVITPARFGVVSVASVDAGANRLIRCVSDTAIPGVATTFTGTAYLDENFTFSDRIPADVTTRSRWSDSVFSAGLLFGGKFNPLGGLQSTPGTTVELVRSPLINAIMGHSPRPLFSSLGDSVRVLGASLPQSDENPVFSAAPVGVVNRCAFIDRECLSFIGTINDNPDVRRAALGTQARSHIQNSPLYSGCPSAVGREVEIWVYNDPAHCLDTQYRYRGIVDIAPEFTEGMTRVALNVRGAAFLPRSIVPSIDAIALVKKPVIGFYDSDIDGVYNYIEVAQADPASTWSWCRFGSVLVRVKKTEVYTPTDLGYTYVRYQLPWGFHRLAFTTADPKISKRDAINLTAGSDPVAWDLWLRRYADPSIVSDPFIEDLEAERRGIIEARENWFSPNGTVQSRFYFHAKPEMCHLFESGTAHATALALDIWDSENDDDLQAVNTSGFYIPSVSVLDIVSQVIKSVDGSGGGFNLLPSELCVGSVMNIVPLQTTEFPFVSGALISASNSSDLGKWLSDSILKPTFTSLAIGADGNWRLFFPVGFIGGIGKKTEAAVTVNTIIGSASSIAPVYTSEYSIRDISLEIVSLGQAFLTQPDERIEVGRDAIGDAYYAAGDIYAGAITNAAKFSYIQDPDNGVGGYINTRYILAMFGRPLYSITTNVHRSYAGDVGDYVQVTLPEVPSVYGDSGFDGYGFVIERSINRQTDESTITFCLFPDPAQGVRVWTPAFDVLTGSSTTALLVQSGTYRSNQTSQVGPLLPGQSVILLNQYGTRRDDTGATVSTYTEDSIYAGTITLTSAFQNGGVDVTPVAGDIVIHDDRTEQTGATTLQFAWFDSSLSTPSRWL
jgi:hypothetical protein